MTLLTALWNTAVLLGVVPLFSWHANPPTALFFSFFNCCYLLPTSIGCLLCVLVCGVLTLVVTRKETLRTPSRHSARQTHNSTNWAAASTTPDRESNNNQLPAHQVGDENRPNRMATFISKTATQSSTVNTMSDVSSNHGGNPSFSLVDMSQMSRGETMEHPVALLPCQNIACERGVDVKKYCLLRVNMILELVLWACCYLPYYLYVWLVCSHSTALSGYRFRDSVVVYFIPVFLLKAFLSSIMQLVRFRQLNTMAKRFKIRNANTEQVSVTTHNHVKRPLGKCVKRPSIFTIPLPPVNVRKYALVRRGSRDVYDVNHRTHCDVNHRTHCPRRRRCSNNCFNYRRSNLSMYSPASSNRNSLGLRHLTNSHTNDTHTITNKPLDTETYVKSLPLLSPRVNGKDKVPVSEYRAANSERFSESLNGRLEDGSGYVNLAFRHSLDLDYSASNNLCVFDTRL